MEIFSEAEKTLIYSSFQEVLNNCPRALTDDDRELIRKAFKIAYEAHNGMRRKSGEPYIMHPIAVARIATQEIGLGLTAFICALLHDAVEDTDLTLEEIENIFGEKITGIIDGLTKISGVFDNKSSLQAENFRRLLLTLSKDIRVILIKLADRLHNMRTLDALPPHKQYKIAGETIYLYAPLAHRLGFNAIKSELEDLSLKYQHPKIYQELSKKIKDREQKNYEIIEEFALPIRDKLKSNNIDFDVAGRTKTVYSIWNKMQKKGVTFDDIYDLLAIRIVFKAKPGTRENLQCWNVYSLITEIYTPKPERIRDWISQPKANGYEALHITVMGPQGKWFEVQIRSERMDEIAERGLAAHWKYKGKNQKENEGELDKWLKKLQVQLQNPNSDALQFLDEFKLNLFSQEIMVFTPKGKLIKLPTDATVLDFAYEIHSGIGNKAIGAKVNLKLVPLNYMLSSGDQVEIITSDKQRTQSEWLDYVNTAKAKTSITDALKSEHKDRIIRGQRILENKLKELDITPSYRIFKKLSDGYKVTSKDELYSKIGSNLITLDDITKVLKRKSESRWIKSWSIQFNKGTAGKKEENGSKKRTNVKVDNSFLITEQDKSKINYKIATCCNPIPGDDVVGFKNPDGSIVIHHTSCSEALVLMATRGETIVSAKWASYKIELFLARLRIRGIDRAKMLSDITNILSGEDNVSIRTVNFDTSNGILEGMVDLYVHNVGDLEDLRIKISSIKGIERVIRDEKLEE